MKKELLAADLRVIVEMVDPAGIERAASADYPMDFVTFFKQKFSEIRSVLAGDAGDEGFFHVSGSEFEVRGTRFKVRGSGLDVQRSMFRVRCSRFMVLGAWFVVGRMEQRAPLKTG